MKVKATVAQLISLSTTLGQLGGKQHAKLTWAALIDLRRLRDVVEETFKQRDALYTPEYKAFEKAREEFRSKFCTEHELPVDTKNFGKLAYKFEEGVLELTRSEAHRQACDDFSAGSRDFASLLETEAELELQAIDVAWLPKRINLLTFSNLRPVLKDADVYKPHELEDIIISKGDVMQIVQKAVGDAGHFSNSSKGRRPLMEMVFATPVVRRISTFLEHARVYTKEFSELRNAHTTVPEFAIFMETRNAILRDDKLDTETKMKQVNDAHQALPDDVRAKLDAIDTEVAGYADSMVTITTAKLRLNDFDEDIDADLMATLFPLISE